MEPNSRVASDYLHPTGRGTQFGLKELVTGEHPEVDIVAIHGIDGDKEESWRADNGVLWLKDLLPEKIPNARILTYGYDANTHGQEQLATEYMHDHATTFIAKLATFRKETSTMERPIIYVAHSSGGIMLKSALIHAHLCSEDHLKHHQAVARSTYGVAFFGTPHQGSATAELARFILDIRGNFTSISNNILRHLERDSEALQQQLLHYPAVSLDFETKFFYELYDTQIWGRVFKRVFKKVVPKSSAVVPGTINAEAIGINKDHVNMIKFASAEDEDFKTVSGILFLMAKDAPQKTKERWEHNRRVNRHQGDAAIAKETLRCRNHALLNNLPHVDAARFDADSRNRCLEGTRVELLETTFNWIDQDISGERPRIFWLCGQAGTGKTTISLTVADGCQAKHQLGASFFFSRDHADRNDLRLVFPSLAQQLGSYHAPFRTALSEILRQDPSLANIDPKYQFRRLIIEPLMFCPKFPSAVVIIDALDECRDDKPISKMLDILSTHIQDLPFLKFFITSRPEVHIQRGFSNLGTGAQTVILHDIEESVLDGDIERYLRYRFSNTSLLYPYLVESDWPSDIVIKTLVGMSGRLFIFAATAMDFILDSSYSDPHGQLSVLLGQSPVNNPSSQFAFLDQLYVQVLRQAFPSNSTPLYRLTLVKILIGTLVLLCDPLSPSALESLLSLRQGEVRTTLRHLHSVMVVPDAEEHSIQLIHPSFFDFATSRCSESDFRIDSSLCHEQLAIACFEQMKGLKRNICNIQDPSQLNNEIENLANRVKEYISPSVQYACRYWSYHMCNASEGTLLGFLETFCHTRILYWIEALSLIDSLRDGIRQIRTVIEIVDGLPSPPRELVMSLKDMARFIVDYFDIVSVASLQLYHTALPLAPKSIYLPFKHEAKGGIQVLQGGNLDLSEVTRLHNPSPGGVEFSLDGELIVSTSGDAILLWDRGTGTLLKTLKDTASCKYGSVRWARAFPDGKQVISGDDKYTLRIWNIATGVCLKAIKLERYNLENKEKPCYTCSPDFTCIVGTEGNNLVRWSTYNGTVLNILCKHSGTPIRAIAFSPNGLLVASSSEDETVRLWDAVNSMALRILRGHYSSVCSVAFSPNNQYLIAGCVNGNILLWDVTNGVALNTLKGHKGAINSVAFSLDSTSIISGSNDKTIRVWNVTRGRMLKTIKCSGEVWNVQISPDGAQYIMSMDNGIYLWDSDDVPSFNRSKKKWNFCDVRFSPDGTHIISGEYDVYLWDGLTGVLLETLKGHSKYINSLAFSPDSKYFASGSDDQTLRLWDMSRRSLWLISWRRAVKVMRGHSDRVCSVAFSPDSTSIVSTSHDNTVRIWDVANGNNVFIIHTPSCVVSADFTPDGSQIIAFDRTYDIPLQLRSHSTCSNHMGAEVPLYSMAGKWIFSGQGRNKKRCVLIPVAWKPCRMCSSHDRVAIGTLHGLVLLDLSNINMPI